MSQLNAAVVADLWKKAKDNRTPKEPYLQSVLRFMFLHENFHEMWEKLAADSTITLVVDGENVVLHVAMDAAARTESRGVHYRSDHPKRDDRRWKKHIVAKS